MSTDYRAKGSGDFIASTKDERLFHSAEDCGRLYREGWHDARRRAPGHCDTCDPQRRCWATGYACAAAASTFEGSDHAGHAPIIPFPSPSGAMGTGPEAEKPAAVPVAPAKTSTPQAGARERPKDGAPDPAEERAAGWQGFESGSWHFFDRGARKSVCKRATRSISPALPAPNGLVCSLCEAEADGSSQLDLF